MEVYIILAILLILPCILLFFVEGIVLRLILLSSIFISLWLFAGLRHFVGTDYPTYLDFYEKSMDLPFEPAYYFIRLFLKSIGLPAASFFLFCSFITIFFFFKAIYKYSVEFELSLILFLLLGFFTNSMNIMRQMIAIGLYIMYGYKYLVAGNFKKYFITVLLISLFHFSVLFLIPFYFIIRRSYSFIAMILFICFAVIFNMGLLNVHFVEYFMGFLPTNYAGYLRFLDHYLSQFNESLGYKLLSNIDKLTILFILFLNKEKLKKIDSSNVYLINLYLFYTTFSIATRGLEELQRFVFYFSVFSIFSIPLLVQLVDNKYIKLLIKLTLIFFYFGWFYTFILQKNFGDIIPYHSVFSGN